MKRKTKRANTVVSDRSKRLAIRVEIFRIFQVFLFLSFFFIWKNKAGQPKRTNNNTLFSVQEDDALLSQVFCKVSMMKLFTRLGDGGFMVKVVALFFSRAGSFVLTGEEATVYHVCIFVQRICSDEQNWIRISGILTQIMFHWVFTRRVQSVLAFSKEFHKLVVVDILAST